MHGSLHNAILSESLQTLDRWGVQIMPPRDDYGKHNLPGEKEITVAACGILSNSVLKNMPILVTGGPTPVIIDNIRRLTNRFTGQLGAAIAEELYLRGAKVQLIHGRGSYTPPAYLPHEIIETYDEYLGKVMGELESKDYKFGIFSAAVADYRLESPFSGKKSGGVTGNRP